MFSPLDGAIGISPDSNVVIGFSESMDKATVEGAFSLSTGNCGQFAWNSDATQFTFNPCTDWAYGTNVDIVVGDTAADLLGLGMAGSFELSFRVLRQTTWKLYSEPDRDGHVYWNSYVSPDAAIFFVSRTARGFMSFDLSLLPNNLVEIQAASVHARQGDSMIGSYGPLTGNVLIESLSYGTLSSSDFYTAPFKLCPKICLGSAPTSRLFSDNPLDGWKSADMLTAVRADWDERATRGDRSQFRLRYEKECGGSPCENIAALSFDAGGTLYQPYLLVTYTHP